MIRLIVYIIVVATIAAFVITLLRKWGVIEYVQVHGNDLFSTMFNCNFCLSWWVSVIISMILFFVMFDPLALIVPFCSTPITRVLL